MIKIKAIFCGLLLIGFLTISFKQIGTTSFSNGKEVYINNCQSCHMEKGEGVEGLNPPLAKTTYLKDTKKIINIILKGQSGEITVNGKKYNTIMPAQDYLTDQQIADVLTYIRNSWGNKYPAVTTAQVKAQRKK
jgi:mono/diheme cytochrome c family protein